MKKILALVLALVMLLSVLAACNNEKPVETKPQETKPAETKPAETKPAETEAPSITFPLAEPMDVSVMYVLGNASYSVIDNVAWKYMQELSGFNFITTEFAPSEAKEKENLLLSSGEYTDILFKANKIDVEKYGMDGIMIPLEDMIKEHMPTLCALLDERNAWGDITAPDGHIYSLPLIQKADPNGTGGSYWWINKGWLDKLGLEEPKTLEELYTVLKAFKEQDPNGNGKADEIPIAGNLNSNWNVLLALFGAGEQYSDYWTVVDGQMEYMPTTEYFKENMIEFLAKLYAEGILDPDIFTQDRDQFRAICAAEEVVYGMLWDSSCAYFSNADERYNWVTLKPVNTETWGLGKGVYEGALCVTDKCQNPEVILAFMDYLYTEEGGMIIRHGKEDVSYKWNEDGTWVSISEGFDSNVYQATLMGSASPAGKIPDSYYDLPASEATRYNNKEVYGKGYGVAGAGNYSPVISLTEEENEEYSILHTDIKAYVSNYIAECVTGITSVEETWDTFQKTLKEMEVDRMIEIYRGAYERALG